MDANQYLSWCKHAVGSVQGLYWAKEEKERVAHCLASVYFKFSRFFAALTYCFYFGTEYVLSVQCSVHCLGKHPCDSLEFLDVSSASSATKKENLFGVS